MAIKTFPPSEYKEQAKALLKEGKKPEEVHLQYPISVRTLYRYLKEIEQEKAGTGQPGKKTTPPIASIGVARESFTPAGTPVPPPPGSPTLEYLKIGDLRMPLEDWGYSTSGNLYVVADTWDIARREYSFPKTMKVGDFMAELCRAFRFMKGWDVPGAGVPAAKVESKMEVRSR